mgnify:CR=1 FL=1
MSYVSDSELLSPTAAERNRRRAHRYTWLFGLVFLVGAPGAYFVANSAAANYTAEGAYLRFRAKFDQQSVREAAEWINK